MEDNGVLGTLVNYFKNCNIPSLSLLDLNVVLFTNLIEREIGKRPYSKECLS